jgi:hypothetical protein
MQQLQQQGAPERISWARAMIFAIGFFLIAAILIGQLPGYIYLQVTAASLQGMEIGALGLGLVCLGGFVIIQVIVLLFDPKPLVPPIIFTGLGTILSLGGLALLLWSTLTGCSSAQQSCNQYFPSSDIHAPSWHPLLGGTVLWFQPNAVDFVMIAIVLFTVGVAMIFYSQLAIREQRNPDRRDLGTTPAIRWMLILGSILLVAFMVFYTYADVGGLGAQLFPSLPPFMATRLITWFAGIVLAASLLMTTGAFALRLHYLMRPVRKRTMSILYAYGALGLAQIGVILILAWFAAYPFIAWMHTWVIGSVGLGDYLTVCGRKSFVPGSCSLSQEGGYIIDAIVTTNFFVMLMAAIWAWKSHRNVVVIGGVITASVIAGATLLIHTSPSGILIAMMLAAGMLIVAAVWTIVARREFAVVGENNLGCLGQWLVVGTCFFVYLAGFAFFSVPTFSEVEPNIPFIGGIGVGPLPAAANQPPPIVAPDAMVMVALMAILGAIQFYFLTRNRYKV